MSELKFKFSVFSQVSPLSGICKDLTFNPQMASPVNLFSITLLVSSYPSNYRDRQNLQIRDWDKNTPIISPGGRRWRSVCD